MKNMSKFLLPIILLFAFLNANAQSNSDEKTVYDFVEQMPVFPGGDNEFFKFLSNSIIYPETAREKNIQGTVFVTFIVEKNGELSEIEILRGVQEDIDKEAIRVISTMPNWSPGKKNGKPVRVQCNLPLEFALKGKKKNKNK
jgi:protein TonB